MGQKEKSQANYIHKNQIGNDFHTKVIWFPVKSEAYFGGEEQPARLTLLIAWSFRTFRSLSCPVNPQIGYPCGVEPSLPIDLNYNADHSRGYVRSTPGVMYGLASCTHSAPPPSHPANPVHRFRLVCTDSNSIVWIHICSFSPLARRDTESTTEYRLTLHLNCNTIRSTAAGKLLFLQFNVGLFSVSWLFLRKFTIPPIFWLVPLRVISPSFVQSI